MSRSYKRRPFMAICGGSAKHDKVLAHRGERRANARAIHEARKQDFEDFLPPHKLECAWNEVYSWGRDGNQLYQALDTRDWFRYLESTSPDDYFGTWPPEWYKKMMRK